MIRIPKNVVSFVLGVRQINFSSVHEHAVVDVEPVEQAVFFQQVSLDRPQLGVLCVISYGP